MTAKEDADLRPWPKNMGQVMALTAIAGGGCGRRATIRTLHRAYARTARYACVVTTYTI